MTLRRHLYSILEGREQSSRLGLILDWIIVSLILVSVVSVMLETVIGYEDKYGHWFHLVEVCSVVAFTIEYVLRLWVAVEEPAHRGHPSWKARLQYMIRPLALIDLLAIAPFYLAMAGVFAGTDLLLLRLIRLLRILKLAHYSRAIGTFLGVLQAEWRALAFAFSMVAIMLVLSSALIYHFERSVQPEAFSSIPQALWWAMATMTTVGYGDIVPVTPEGRMIGGLVMLTGIGLFGLWTGIIASGFTEEIRKRSFIINWDLVASVPLFQDLSAAQIGQIVRLLHPLEVPPRYAVVRRGEEVSGLYFIVAGQLEADLPSGPFRLQTGDHFGELALLSGSRTPATIVSLSAARLMVLEEEDFHELMEAHPQLREELQATAEARSHWVMLDQGLPLENLRRGKS
ncbi:cyclic nucleotide-gated ion channel [Aestuariispira ectoiniformans]|uniref:cyclic nucleotide-gated ion channel n=1 Tax=Aestuariispira ectoiniformans TaxID=2775080 RepID=UPI00223BF7FC|nr:cyclic nucleotide-gated ion channel [Aestuariispira ectoiniformans]